MVEVDGHREHKSVVCLGEILVDLVEIDHVDVSQGQASRFYQQHLGGAPANVAVNLYRLGTPVALVSAVGEDDFGRFLLDRLRAYGLDVSTIHITEAAHTTLAFIHNQGEAQRITFYRHPGADAFLFLSQKAPSLMGSSSILHVGTFLLSQEPARSTQLHMIREAKTSNMLISCDINLRLAIWNSLDEAKFYAYEMIRHSNIVKLTAGELESLTGTADAEEGSTRIWQSATQLVIITSGGRGAFFRTRNCRGYVDRIDVPFQDPVGAGDGFVAGLLHYYSQIAKLKPLESMAADELYEMIRYSNAVAAIVVSSRGAIPEQLTDSMVRSLLMTQLKLSEQSLEPVLAVLFDIDGTLLGDVEIYRSLNYRAVSDVIGKEVTAGSYVLDGKTDPENLKALLLLGGIDGTEADALLPDLIDHYKSLVKEEFAKHSPMVLPGILPLLNELSRRGDILLGVLTGNVESVAEIKLEAAQLHSYFKIGAYGSDDPDRYKLPQVALRKIQEQFGLSLNPSQLVIVGDTKHDVGCAKGIGSRAIAVATGGVSKEELAEAGPDALLDNLSDTKNVLELVVGFAKAY